LCAPTYKVEVRRAKVTGKHVLDTTVTKPHAPFVVKAAKHAVESVEPAD